MYAKFLLDWKKFNQYFDYKDTLTERHGHSTTIGVISIESIFLHALFRDEGTQEKIPPRVFQLFIC